MYPFIELWFLGNIYTFGLTLMFCFFVFLTILKKVCSRFWINFSFFSNRILLFFLSTLFFSRLFFVLSYWNDYKFLDSPVSFLIMSDYNFSLPWAIFWYLVVLFFSTAFHRIQNWKYLDASVLAFLFTSIFWFIWAFLGWQIYWRETYYWIEVVYNHPFSPIPYDSGIFPLAIVYSIIVFILFSFLYIIAMFIRIRGIIGYIWLWLFASVVLILESFSWKFDFFYQSYWLSLNKWSAIALLIFSFYWLFKISISSNKERDLTL